MRHPYDRLTIEFETTPGGMFSRWKVFGHGVYPESSVLAGQAQRVFLAEFKTQEEAQERYPGAEVLEHSTKPIRYEWDSLTDLSGLPERAPDWFDPADAGERWDDDY